MNRRTEQLSEANTLLEEKQEEMKILQPEESMEQETEEEHVEEKRARKGMKKGKILENLKNTLSDIFDETDVKM